YLTGLYPEVLQSDITAIQRDEENKEFYPACLYRRHADYWSGTDTEPGKLWKINRTASTNRSGAYASQQGQRPPDHRCRSTCQYRSQQGSRIYDHGQRLCDGRSDYF